jgi:peptidoglycan/xylan/chitin deacetylase (PgdA/CDA1 family)
MIPRNIQRHKVLTIIFSLFMVTSIAFAGISEKKSDESFAKWFKAYFLASQPEQVITSEIYQKPPKDESVMLPIIVYHSVRPSYVGETELVKRFTTEPAILDQEFAHLKERGYQVISFNELLKYFDEGKPLPPKAVVLTFDDGWKNQYTYAFPLLKKYGFTATFFIFTNAIGHKNFLSWEQIKEMDAAGMTIGGHTKTHPYLTKITDPQKLAAEIAGGKKILEDHLGKKVDVFAYPFGLYNDAVVKAVRDAGYRIGRTSNPGLYQTEAGLLTTGCLYDQNRVSGFKVFEKLAPKQ